MTHDNSVIYIVPCTLLAACYALLTTGNYSRNARNGIQAVCLYIYILCTPKFYYYREQLGSHGFKIQNNITFM